MRKLAAIIFAIVSISCYAQQYISPFNFPLFLSGTFGELRSNHFHTGIDIKTNEQEGYEIKAIADGYISRIKISTWGYGKVLYIDHFDGNTSVYAHMQIFNKEIEDIIQKQQYIKESFEINYYASKDSIFVKQGETIGLSGNSGGSGGPHLHFEIRDTESQQPINPLKFGFDVADNIDPVLLEIKIYSHDDGSVNNHQNIRIPLIKSNNKEATTYKISSDSTIKVNGNISFGISTFDRQNGAPNNKNGVYEIKMFVDNKLIHHFEADKLSFDEKRFINAHIDYEEYMEKNIRFNRCYTLPHNKLSNYKTNINNGIYHFFDTLVHDVRFEISDIKKNVSILNLNVKSQKNSANKEESTNNNMLIFNEDNIYKNLKFEAHIKEYSLYENCNISYEIFKKQKNTISEIHRFINNTVPLHKEMVISIKDDVPEKIKNKSYVAKLIISETNKDSTFQYKGKIWKDGFLCAKTREFGDYCIVADTVNPKISDIKINKEKNFYGGEGKIHTEITDEESGLSYYRGDIDGKWALMEYDYKTNLLTYYIPSNFSKGNHTITITVRDRVNNETKKTINFKY